MRKLLLSLAVASIVVGDADAGFRHRRQARRGGDCGSAAASGCGTASYATAGGCSDCGMATTSNLAWGGTGNWTVPPSYAGGTLLNEPKQLMPQPSTLPSGIQRAGFESANTVMPRLVPHTAYITDANGNLQVAPQELQERIREPRKLP